MIICESDVDNVKDYDKLRPESAWLLCGICSDLSEVKVPAQVENGYINI